MAEFDPDAYLANKPAVGGAGPSGFDPDAYLQKKSLEPASTRLNNLQSQGLSIQKNPKNPDLEATVQGLGQAVTAGYEPQVEAAVGGLIPNPTSDIDAKLRAQGFDVQNSPDTYISRRDAAIARDQSLQQQSPGSYLAGTVLGSIASAPVAGKAIGVLPGMSAAKNVGTVGKLAQAAGGGAVMGAFQNPGDYQGRLSGIQAQERLKNAGMGAAVGGAAQAAGSAINAGAKIVSDFGNKLIKASQAFAYKSAGAYMIKDLKKASVQGGFRDIGQAMIDHGFVKPGSTFEDVADSASSKRQEVGKVIGDIYDKANKVISNPTFLNELPTDTKKLLLSTNFNPKYDAKFLAHQFKNELKGKPGGTQAFSRVSTLLDELKDNGKNVNLSVMQDFKKGLDDIIMWNKPLHEEPLAIQSIAKVRDYLKDRIQDRVNAMDVALGSNSLASLKDANKQYGNLAEIERIAKNRIFREQANNLFGLRDTMIGSAIGGAISAKQGHVTPEAVAGGLAAGAASAISRKYGAPILTTGAYNAGKYLNQPNNLISSGGGLLGNNPVPLGAAAVNISHQSKKNKK